MALLMVGDRPAAEDVVQDAFAALHARMDRFTDHDNALPYIRAAVLNGCRTVLRKRRRPFFGQDSEPVWSAEADGLLGEGRRDVLGPLRTLLRRQRARPER